MMNKRQVETKHLYWGPITSADYLWGSTIQKLAKDRVLFKNSLMPSGQIVKKWQSITRYDGDRMAPTLPLLKRGKAYRLDVSMSSKPAHTVLVEIVFQDRFGVTVERKVTSDGSLSFLYPEQAYAYQVRLLSAGMQEFTFDYFIISSISSEEAGVPL